MMSCLSSEAAICSNFGERRSALGAALDPPGLPRQELGYPIERRVHGISTRVDTNRRHRCERCDQSIACARAHDDAKSPYARAQFAGQQAGGG
jgi:hypothetical protein